MRKVLWLLAGATVGGTALLVLSYIPPRIRDDKKATLEFRRRRHNEHEWKNRVMHMFSDN